MRWPDHVCSTPLGVTDLVTGFTMAADASRKCSTPLGVTDLVTGLDGDIASRLVLNASRRH